MLPIQNNLLIQPNVPGLRNGPPGIPQGLGFGAGGNAGGNDSQRALAELQARALDNLARQIPGVGGVKGLAQLNPAEFTPEKVADRIAGFVESGLAGARARGASETELQSLKDRAVQGVERGFREARDILKGLSLLNGKVEEDVDRTEQLTFDRLLGRSGAPGSELQQLDSLNLSAVERFQKAEALELRVKTQSGKEVTIQFSRSLEQSSAVSLDAGPGRVSMAMDISRFEASGYRFSVSGDLNDDELQAVQNLVQDVGRMANEFFSGDVQRAFEQVGSLRFDGRQLASMELNMARVESYSMAQRYEQTQRLGSGEASDSRPGLRLGQLMQDMREQFNASVLEFLDRPQQMAETLMRGLVTQDTRFKEANDSQQARFQENLDRLLAAAQSLDSTDPAKNPPKAEDAL